MRGLLVTFWCIAAAIMMMACLLVGALAGIVLFVAFCDEFNLFVVVAEDSAEFILAVAMVSLLALVGSVAGMCAGIALTYVIPWQVSHILGRCSLTRKIGQAISEAFFGEANASKKRLMHVLWEQLPLPQSLANFLFDR